jgi:type II secretory pathway pseudopilin PulG
VIVVIGILAAITIVSYAGIQGRAQGSRINADIEEIGKAVQLARLTSQETLAQITGSNSTGGNCWGKAAGTDLSTLVRTDPCWTSYVSALNLISNASGMNIRNMVDPWGRPYLIDENEGEGGGCTKDTVAVFTLPFTSGFGTYSTTPANNITLSGYSGCTV